ncbi:MAG: bifunctional hydroxymethylpyrimidine kinase/phosphomethylpyrimidine kinase [Micrococcales bacterium]|nr:MAG: bifunctional hydroxymethylpyrimidine kinase/phosphomethylpyrimidine kinase [Micrococcales bacterium]PIE27522.1 MAG: bifunctional hydroxymethylpyrimidine kinase/phosphomethylpyrimidine kinase [Micrococcales bacterium]
MTVAGSDPSGGAGIQADLKTFAAFGVYGCAVLTALTAQNTRGVSRIHQPPADFVAQQLRDVLDDVTVDAVKIGMVGEAATARTIADVLVGWRSAHPGSVVVLDPVMVSTLGHRLLAEDASHALAEQLFPVVDLITPNLPEAALLLGRPVATDPGQMRAQAAELVDRGAPAVLVKGGHLLLPQRPSRAGRTAVDVLIDNTGIHELSGAAVDTPNTHGTGCTLSSALAAEAAIRIHGGRPVDGRWQDIATVARSYLTRALAAGAEWRLGTGSGPVEHRVPVAGPR